jgi:hypothetical protein
MDGDIIAPNVKLLLIDYQIVTSIIWEVKKIVKFVT